MTRSRVLSLTFACSLATGCEMQMRPFTLPTATETSPDAIIDIHAHFFSFLCDFPPAAAGETLHVGDRWAMKRIVSRAAGGFKKKRGAPRDWEALCRDVDASKGATRLMRDDYGRVDFARAAVSDRRAIAAAYFELFPQVALVTPSMIDADGWLNNPNALPTTESWKARHRLQQALAKSINDEYGFVRVLPIAGFNPMRGVRVDCSKPLRYATAGDCNDQWRWQRVTGPRGDAYLRAFEHMLRPRTGGLPPFVGIKIYPSLGYPPTPICEQVGAAWRTSSKDFVSCEDFDTRGDYAVCRAAAAVAMAPIRNPEAWEGLPVPGRTSGCRAIHDALMARLFEGDVRQVEFWGTEKNVVEADYSQLRNKIQLVAFLRLSAEIDRVMAEMLTMANALDLPIIAHASPEGFALDDDFFENGYPEPWEATLARYPNLRVLFAHAGGSELEGKKKDDAFFDAVSCLQRNHPRVFVDYSNRHGKAWPDAVATRAVYGSDFWMMTLGGKSKNYLESHRNLFPNPADAQAYLSGNAIDFLAPPHSPNRRRICSYAKAHGGLATTLQPLCP